MNGNVNLSRCHCSNRPSADEMTYFRSSYFEIWDPTDLGREVVFTLRETRPTWQSQPLLTANQIADALGRRMDPTSPLFDSRLGSFVREVSVRSPSELKIRFSRVPLSIESLLRFPIIAAPRIVDNDKSDATATLEPSAEMIPADATGATLLSTRFKLGEADNTGTSYLRERPEPDGLDPSKYHVAEVREESFTDRNELLKFRFAARLTICPISCRGKLMRSKLHQDFRCESMLCQSRM